MEMMHQESICSSGRGRTTAGILHGHRQPFLHINKSIKAVATVRDWLSGLGNTRAIQDNHPVAEEGQVF